MSYTIFRTLTGEATVRRDNDGAFIPEDPLNTDWQAYQAWLKAGDAPVSGAPGNAPSAPAAAAPAKDA